MNQTWTLPLIPRAHNELHGRHWRSKHAERQRWAMIFQAMPFGPWWANRDKNPQRVRVKITVFRWNRQDSDNAVASVKPLVDALEARGYLVDDSPRWLELEVTEEIDRKEQRTEIEWEALGD